MHEYNQFFRGLVYRSDEMTVEPNSGAAAAVNIAIGSVFLKANNIGDALTAFGCSRNRVVWHIDLLF
jgi:hypothetical protein